ncbi:MAG: hypothetical protein HY243_15770 [Proteobacteria bacterium]|nr:hypothetical protein [Pseudomonadota bacterium]
MHPRLNINTLRLQAASGATVPFWTSLVTSPVDGLSYTTSMVGASPFATTTNTNVTYAPIVLRIHFGRNVVLDPTRPDCSDTVAISSRFFSSPLFQPSSLTSNGVYVGTVQLISGYQRANFWTSVSSSGYGVTLVASGAPIVVDVNAPLGSRVSSITLQCGNSVKTVKLGQIDINRYDSLIQSVISRYSNASQLPVVLTYNVVQTISGSCCVLGYHNAVPVSSGTQTYAVGSYIDSGIFSGVDDIVVWSHELAEWLDDPFVQASVPGGGNDDLTPAWGHVGQVSGCQNNLENADPLSGTEFALSGAGGFVYHFQDIAFEDWFYRTPAQGTRGLFSFTGDFATDAGAVCH